MKVKLKAEPNLTGTDHYCQGNRTRTHPRPLRVREQRTEPEKAGATDLRDDDQKMITTTPPGGEEHH